MKHYVAVRHTRSWKHSANRYSGAPAVETTDVFTDSRICPVEDDGTFQLPGINASYPLRGKLEPARLKVIGPDSSYWYAPLLRDADGVLRSVWPVLDYDYVIKEDVDG